MRVLLLIIILCTFDKVSVVYGSGISVETDMVEPVFAPGEIGRYSVWITNNLKENQTITISPAGKISNLLEVYFEGKELSTSNFKLSTDTTEHLELIVNAPENPGIYTGYLVLSSGWGTQAIPISVKVIDDEPLMDVKVEAITKELSLGSPLKFYVSLYNLGFKERFDVHLVYAVKELETERVLTKVEEEMAIETSLSFVRVIPAENLSLEAGRYYIEAAALYENKSASAADIFTVFKPFWTTTKKIAVLPIFAGLGLIWYKKKTGNIGGLK